VTPVTPLPAISARFARWAALATTVVIFEVWFLGMRGDLGTALPTPGFAFSFGFALVTATAAAVLALRLSVPGAAPGRWRRLIPMMVVVLWAGLLWQTARATGTAAGASGLEPIHFACVLRVIGIAALPSAGLLISVRNGFVIDRGWAATLALVAGAALAAGAVQLACPIDRAAHLFVSHLMPAIVLAALGPALARLAFPVGRS
jgi:hypothetical protein